MKITEEQKALLESLRCERLASNQDNMRIVENFFNRRNPSLVNTLQNEAFEEDEDGSIAYYVVKDAKGHILFFFSLKCGSLYDSHVDSNVIKLIKKLNAFVQESLSDPELTERQRESMTRFLEKIRAHKGVSKYDLDNLPKKMEQLFADLEKELSKEVTHVGRTYSSIELVHFCSNNEYDEVWHNLSLPHSVGVVVFWYFIVEKVLETMQFIGVQYLFLFAADLSDNDSLIGFYMDRLDFIRDDERATIKPIYDLTCEFMYQEVNDLEKRRQLFFDNFNPDTEEV